MIQATVYWSLITVAATCATGFALGADPVTLEMVTNAGNDFKALQVPEPSRAGFLGLGIIAVAATYRRAWVNLRRHRG